MHHPTGSTVKDSSGHRAVALPLSQPMRLMASGIDHDPLPESDTGANHVYRKGDKITSLSEQNIHDATSLGFRVLQIAVGSFFNQDIGPDGRGDWREMDANLEILSRFDMEAMLVAGFHWIPSSMGDDSRAVALRCLTHNQPIPMFSIWSPFTYEWIQRCTAALAEHLRTSPARIAAIQVALCGDFGEAIFPAGMLNVLDTQMPNISGTELHTHGDFWCNDRCARAAYVDFLATRPESSASVGHSDPADSDLFPTCPAGGSPTREWLDFLQWYHDSMTDYAQRVVGIFRHHFPDLELAIWLGGGVEPHKHGQDNTALPKALKRSRATIRSTASAFQMAHHCTAMSTHTLAWSFQKNYPIVKRIATACRFYDVPLWSEPPYPPGLESPMVAARVFEAISCGVAGYFEWTRTLQRQQDTYDRLIPLLSQERALVDVAVYFPITSHRSVGNSHLPEPFWHVAALARSVADYDVVDDRLIRDGALNRYSILVAPQLDLIEADVMELMRNWVQAGGILLVEDCGPIQILENCKVDQRCWLGIPPQAQQRSGKILPAQGNQPNLPTVHRWFSGKTLDSFDRVADDAEPVLVSSAGAAVVRCTHEKGLTFFCTRGEDTGRLLVAVLKDILDHAPQTAHLPARFASQWMQANECVFATAFEQSILLANLSPQAVQYDAPGHAVTLQGYDLLQVPTNLNASDPSCRAPTQEP